MKILAIDPSFAALAYSYYDGADTIYVGHCTTPLGTSIGFEKVYDACDSQFHQFKEHLEGISGFEPDVVFSETPPPVSQFSAGLYALDTYILHKLWDLYPSIQQIHIFSSSYLGTVHETKKYKKSESTQLANYFIEEVLQDHFKVILPDRVNAKGTRSRGKMNNDRAESFLFLLRAMCRYDIKGLQNTIIGEAKGLGHEAEKLLSDRGAK